MIRLEGVSRRFGRRRRIEAVQEVTLEVPAGEVCAVAGPNGAGKSTLLALALGFLRPSAGDVTLFDDAPRDFLRREPVGYVPERVQLPPGLRVSALLHGLAAVRAARDAESRALDAMQAFGLGPYAERRVGELSRGLLQRVALAQALLDEPRVLVLDEPTEGLDPLWRVRLREHIAAARARGAAVLLASHDLAELEHTADRVVLLERGRILRELEPRGQGGGRYLVRTRAGGEWIAELFPGSAAVGEGEYEVAVTDAAELSGRLAAWLARGGLLESVQPLALEARARPAFEEDA